MAILHKQTILDLLGKGAPALAKAKWEQALKDTELIEKDEYSLHEALEIGLAIAQNTQKELELYLVIPERHQESRA